MPETATTSIALGDGINLRGAIDGGPGTDTHRLLGVDDRHPREPRARHHRVGRDARRRPGKSPDHATPATGTATVTNYNIATHTFDITVTVTGLPPADVTGFHIHQAAVGVNGPIIVDFTGAGRRSFPSGTGFTFTATGLPLPAVNEAAFLGGGTYVNVHTAVFPGGAIRGQLFSGGNVNLATGAATGTASVANIENVTGGAGNDSLVGSFASTPSTAAPARTGSWAARATTPSMAARARTCSCGATATARMSMKAARTPIPSRSTAAPRGADVFTVAANGTRLDFDRTNLGPFSLDIGTVGDLDVNGIGGDDSFTVNDLTGVASLATLNLNGFDGNDTFAYAPPRPVRSCSTPMAAPAPTRCQGPNGASTWNVTAANPGNIAGLVRRSASSKRSPAGRRATPSTSKPSRPARPP